MPTLHTVPPSIGMTVDQRPEAQRWNPVPPGTQFHMPSLVHVSPAAMIMPVESLPPAAGGGTFVGVAGVAGVAAGFVIVDMMDGDGAAGAPPPVGNTRVPLRPGTNMPPGTLMMGIAVDDDGTVSPLAIGMMVSMVIVDMPLEDMDGGIGSIDMGIEDADMLGDVAVAAGCEVTKTPPSPAGEEDMDDDIDDAVVVVLLLGIVVTIVLVLEVLRLVTEVPADAEDASADDELEEPSPEEPDPDPEPDPGLAPDPFPEPDPDVAPQAPVGGADLVLFTSTSGPGFGKMTSEDSTVVQPLPMLAVKIVGRLEKESDGPRLAILMPLPPPPTVTTAQFMYISRFPIVLNHVQANTASSVRGVSLGSVNRKLLDPCRGQEPT